MGAHKMKTNVALTSKYVKLSVLFASLSGTAVMFQNCSGGDFQAANVATGSLTSSSQGANLLKCSFNGQELASGAVAPGFSAATVAFGKTCASVAELVTCNNGVLNDPGAVPNCTVSAGAACSFHGQTVQSGSSVSGFSAASVPNGQLCSTVAITVSCMNGTLSPANAFALCAVGAPAASCMFNGSTITSGGTTTGYKTSSVAYGQTCTSKQEVVTCTNGILSPTGAFGTCTVAQPASCSFNGSTIASGGTATGYSVSTVPTGTSCSTVQEVVTCSNGVLSPSGAVDTCNVASASTGAPVVLYTDIVSGPNTGGEGNAGVYLSIFGKNFGSTLSSVHAYINGVEVAKYIYLGSSKGRTDIQQLSVQIGALGNPTLGTALPIKVVVGGVASNTDKMFTVNPGRMIFVDPNGNDSTAVVNDITHPYKTVQTPDLKGGAWGQVQPGDFIVLRKGTHTGVGKENYFMRFITSTASGYASGTAPTGKAGSGPITLMGYPNEDAFINGDASIDVNGCLSGLNGNTFPNAGKWVVIADLRIEGGGYDGPISEEVGGNNWRIINNELTAYTGVTWPMVDAYNAAHGLPAGSQAGLSPSRMAGITGNGLNSFWLGNNIHDINGSDCSHVGTNGKPSPNCTGSEAHGIYIDGFGSYEVAYNHIHDIKSGKGFQSYATGSNDLDSSGYVQNPEVDNVNLHHNLIHNVLTYGINVADSAKAGWVISNNVVYSSGNEGLSFNTMTLVNAKIYNNTILGGSVNNWGSLGGAVDVQNNIVDPSAFGPGNLNGTFKNNLWLNSSSGSVSFGSGAVYGDPLFVNATSDFHLKTGSPAIDKGSSAVSGTVTNDFDITTLRPLGAGYDIGAFEK
jgi:hypothetical protein